MKFPVDVLGAVSPAELEHRAQKRMNELLYSNPDCPETLTLPDSTQLDISASTVGLVPLYGCCDSQKVLALFAPADPFTPAALFLLGQWWSMRDILRTDDSSREGLRQVETLGERIVLYVLNRIVYRVQEMNSDELPFLCHGAKDFAKILWQNGEAVGFYSVKPTGSSCSTFSSRTYPLPVMDSMFVRKCHRGKGLGLHMLEDYVDSFKDDCLGLKYPLTTAMYKVCQSYLCSYPGDAELLWEVDTCRINQRTSVASRLQSLSLRGVSKTLTFPDQSAVTGTVHHTEETMEEVTVVKATKGAGSRHRSTGHRTTEEQESDVRITEEVTLLRSVRSSEVVQTEELLEMTTENGTAIVATELEDDAVFDKVTSLQNSEGETLSSAPEEVPQNLNTLCSAAITVENVASEVEECSHVEEHHTVEDSEHKTAPPQATVTVERVLRTRTVVNIPQPSTVADVEGESEITQETKDGVEEILLHRKPLREGNSSTTTPKPTRVSARLKKGQEFPTDEEDTPEHRSDGGVPIEEQQEASAKDLVEETGGMKERMTAHNESEETKTKGNMSSGEELENNLPLETIQGEKEEDQSGGVEQGLEARVLRSGVRTENSVPTTRATRSKQQKAEETMEIVETVEATKERTSGRKRISRSKKPTQELATSSAEEEIMEEQQQQQHTPDNITVEQNEMLLQTESAEDEVDKDESVDGSEPTVLTETKEAVPEEEVKDQEPALAEEDTVDKEDEEVQDKRDITMEETAVVESAITDAVEEKREESASTAEEESDPLSTAEAEDTEQTESPMEMDKENQPESVIEQSVAEPEQHKEPEQESLLDEAEEAKSIPEVPGKGAEDIPEAAAVTEEGSSETITNQEESPSSTQEEVIDTRVLRSGARTASVISTPRTTRRSKRLVEVEVAETALLKRGRKSTGRKGVRKSKGKTQDQRTSSADEDTTEEVQQQQTSDLTTTDNNETSLPVEADEEKINHDEPAADSVLTETMEAVPEEDVKDQEPALTEKETLDNEVKEVQEERDITLEDTAVVESASTDAVEEKREESASTAEEESVPLSTAEAEDTEQTESPMEMDKENQPESVIEQSVAEPEPHKEPEPESLPEEAEEQAPVVQTRSLRSGARSVKATPKHSHTVKEDVNESVTENSSSQVVDQQAETKTSEEVTSSAKQNSTEDNQAELPINQPSGEETESNVEPSDTLKQTEIKHQACIECTSLPRLSVVLVDVNKVHKSVTEAAVSEPQDITEETQNQFQDSFKTDDVTEQNQSELSIAETNETESNDLMSENTDKPEEATTIPCTQEESKANIQTSTEDIQTDETNDEDSPEVMPESPEADDVEIQPETQEPHTSKSVPLSITEAEDTEQTESPMEMSKESQPESVMEQSVTEPEQHKEPEPESLPEEAEEAGNEDAKSQTEVHEDIPEAAAATEECSSETITNQEESPSSTQDEVIETRVLRSGARTASVVSTPRTTRRSKRLVEEEVAETAPLTRSRKSTGRKQVSKSKGKTQEQRTSSAEEDTTEEVQQQQTSDLTTTDNNETSLPVEADEEKINHDEPAADSVLTETMEAVPEENIKDQEPALAEEDTVHKEDEEVQDKRDITIEETAVVESAKADAIEEKREESASTAEEESDPLSTAEAEDTEQTESPMEMDKEDQPESVIEQSGAVPHKEPEPESLLEEAEEAKSISEVPEEVPEPAAATEEGSSETITNQEESPSSTQDEVIETRVLRRGARTASVVSTPRTTRRSKRLVEEEVAETAPLTRSRKSTGRKQESRSKGHTQEQRTSSAEEDTTEEVQQQQTSDLTTTDNNETSLLVEADEDKINKDEPAADSVLTETMEAVPEEDVKHQEPALAEEDTVHKEDEEVQDKRDITIEETAVVESAKADAIEEKREESASTAEEESDPLSTVEAEDTEQTESPMEMDKENQPESVMEQSVAEPEPEFLPVEAEEAKSIPEVPEEVPEETPEATTKTEEGSSETITNQEESPSSTQDEVIETRVLRRGARTASVVSTPRTTRRSKRLVEEEVAETAPLTRGRKSTGRKQVSRSKGHTQEQRTSSAEEDTTEEVQQQQTSDLTTTDNNETSLPVEADEEKINHDEPAADSVLTETMEAVPEENIKDQEPALAEEDTVHKEDEEVQDKRDITIEDTAVVESAKADAIEEKREESASTAEEESGPLSTAEAEDTEQTESPMEMDKENQPESVIEQSGAEPHKEPEPESLLEEAEEAKSIPEVPEDIPEAAAATEEGSPETITNQDESPSSTQDEVIETRVLRSGARTASVVSTPRTTRRSKRLLEEEVAETAPLKRGRKSTGRKGVRKSKGKTQEQRTSSAEEDTTEEVQQQQTSDLTTTDNNETSVPVEADEEKINHDEPAADSVLTETMEAVPEEDVKHQEPALAEEDTVHKEDEEVQDKRDITIEETAVVESAKADAIEEKREESASTAEEESVPLSTVEAEDTEQTESPMEMDKENQPESVMEQSVAEPEQHKEPEPESLQEEAEEAGNENAKSQTEVPEEVPEETPEATTKTEEGSSETITNQEESPSSTQDEVIETRVLRRGARTASVVSTPRTTRRSKRLVEEEVAETAPLSRGRKSTGRKQESRSKGHTQEQRTSSAEEDTSEEVQQQQTSDLTTTDNNETSVPVEADEVMVNKDEPAADSVLTETMEAVPEENIKDQEPALAEEDTVDKENEEVQEERDITLEETAVVESAKADAVEEKREESASTAEEESVPLSTAEAEDTEQTESPMEMDKENQPESVIEQSGAEPEPHKEPEPESIPEEAEEQVPDVQTRSLRSGARSVKATPKHSHTVKEDVNKSVTENSSSQVVDQQAETKTSEEVTSSAKQNSTEDNQAELPINQPSGEETESNVEPSDTLKQTEIKHQACIECTSLPGLSVVLVDVNKVHKSVTEAAVSEPQDITEETQNQFQDSFKTDDVTEQNQSELSIAETNETESNDLMSENTDKPEEATTIPCTQEESKANIQTSTEDIQTDETNDEDSPEVMPESPEADDVEIQPETQEPHTSETRRSSRKRPRVDYRDHDEKLDSSEYLVSEDTMSKTPRIQSQRSRKSAPKPDSEGEELSDSIVLSLRLDEDEEESAADEEPIVITGRNLRSRSVPSIVISPHSTPRHSTVLSPQESPEQTPQPLKRRGAKATPPRSSKRHRK